MSVVGERMTNKRHGDTNVIQMWTLPGGPLLFLFEIMAVNHHVSTNAAARLNRATATTCTIVRQGIESFRFGLDHFRCGLVSYDDSDVYDTVSIYKDRTDRLIEHVYTGENDLHVYRFKNTPVLRCEWRNRVSWESDTRDFFCKFSAEHTDLSVEFRHYLDLPLRTRLPDIPSVFGHGQGDSVAVSFTSFRNNLFLGDMIVLHIDIWHAPASTVQQRRYLFKTAMAKLFAFARKDAETNERWKDFWIPDE